MYVFFELIYVVVIIFYEILVVEMMDDYKKKVKFVGVRIFIG